MKRIFTLCLALILCLSVVTLFSSCDTPKTTGEETKTTEEKTTEPKTTENSEFPLPEGYARFNNGSVSFAYPATWTKQENGGTAMLLDATNGNNITVTSEPYSNAYDNLTAAGYQQMTQDTFTQAGISIRDVVVKRETLASGDRVTLISHTTTQTGSPLVFKQTIYIVKSGSLNVVVTLTLNGGSVEVETRLKQSFSSVK